MTHELDSNPFPHNTSAEQSVLGALMQDNDAYERLNGLIPAHFYHADHRLIFDAIAKLAEKGQPYDIITLWEVLNSERKAEAVGGLVYLNSLVQNTPGSANIARYAAIVREKYRKRTVLKVGMYLQEQARQSPAEAFILIDDAITRLESLLQVRTEQVPVRASDDLVRHIGVIEGRLDGGVKVIPTGFAEIDDRLSGGIRPGELIVLAARPKMGKTALAINIALNVAPTHDVLVCSLEMPKSQLQDRHLATLGYIPVQHLLQPDKMTEQNWHGVTVAAQKIDAMSLYLDDQAALSLADVRLKAKMQKRKVGLDLIVIDYLQLMSGLGDNRNVQIEGITRGLKALAKELECGILLLSQLNRELERRPNKRPLPSDLRDSGAIEQDADAVIFLYRDDVYNLDSRDVGICEVDIALCRQGEPGRTYLRYIGEQTRFTVMEKSWRPGSGSYSNSGHMKKTGGSGIANAL